MAWEFAGNMLGAPPLIMSMQVGADCYVGQMACEDGNGYGHVTLAAVAAAGPDVSSALVGPIVAVRTSPTYTATTYQSDMADYDTTQAAQLANDPKGAVEVDICVMRPGDMFKAPIGKAAISVNIDTVTATATDPEGDDIAHTADTITAPTHKLSTIYCRSGANKGLYRVITSGGTTDQDVTICFPYDIAVGDVFVCADVKLGPCRIDLSTYLLGIDASAASNYYDAFCHRLNLETAGEEYAVVSFAAHHMWATR